ncbi:NAD(P)H azoreductase [Clavibacter michiganensis subsp. michiganensis]|uniref:NAD(P)H azoreductase n=1 Tax=Clavibacter michiganensis subsp. michiganensis TaxID=33013 RepID=A0A251XIJ9_CLAMM|nr:NAD(P)H azoreductase [Clavibacter michiganensis subsp. michiganensis]OUE02870.1 NAD(P)H azoreductase [Clavibacter michiganensis subsp. michiganensis]
MHEVTYGDRAATLRALTGVEILLMVSAAEDEHRLAQHVAFVDAAAEAGVRHVVYTSFQGAAPDATFTLARDHHATEDRIRASGMAWTFLRDAFYIDFVSQLVGDDGVIRGPAGGGRVAAVTRADVAQVAATILRDPESHAGATYELTGPEALTMAEIAATVAAARQRTVTYRDETLEEARASRAVWQAPEWQLDAWISTYTAMAAGEMAHVSGDVERVLGRRPVSLAEFLASEGRDESRSASAT